MYFVFYPSNSTTVRVNMNFTWIVGLLLGFIEERSP